MRFVNCAVFFMVLIVQTATAQFHTITKYSPIEIKNEIENHQSVDTAIIRADCIPITALSISKTPKIVSGLEGNRYTSHPHSVIPDLNIDNLRKEIRLNGIKFEDIVVAQALIETGNFKSRVCCELNNLFGLTNPRTGKYYEFEDWRDSVRAYRTKVQYRYRDGNYLIWLRDIGYAEDPGYIRAIIKMLKQMKKMS